MTRDTRSTETLPPSTTLQGSPSRREVLRGGAALAALGLAGISLGPAEAADKSDPLEVRFWRAVEGGRLEELGEILDARPGLLTARDTEGRSAFVVAFLAARRGAMELLQERGYEPDVVESCLVPDWERFETLAESDPATVRQAHPVGGTAMYAAARAGAGTEIWRVYRWGGQPDVRIGESFSPLRMALEFEDLATAELTAATLLGNGADPNVSQPGASSPLHAAAARGSVELVEMLIRKGARIDARDAGGATPRDRALEGDTEAHRAAAERLARHREIPRDVSTSRFAYDVDGKTYSAPEIEPADVAAVVARSTFVGACHSRFDEVRASLAEDPDLVHAVAMTDECAVDAGAHMGRRKIVDLLLEHGAPYSMSTAVMRGDFPRVKALLAEDPRRVHERGPHDFALLWYPVIGEGGIEMTRLLLEAGAEVEYQHHLGTTALHWAALAGNRDMAELLLAHGADLHRRGRKFGAEPASPLDLARQRGQDEMVRYLLDRGARA